MSERKENPSGAPALGGDRWKAWVKWTLIVNVCVLAIIPCLNCPRLGKQTASGIASLLPVPIGPILLMLKRSRAETLVAFLAFSLSVFWAITAYGLYFMWIL